MSSDCEPALPLPNVAAIAERSSAAGPPIAGYDSYHRLILAISTAVLLAACVLQVRTDQRVAVALLPGWPLPEVCQSKVLLGIECPGCGLTRSFVHLAHGDVAASLAIHPLGWLVALFVVAQIPYRLWAIATHSAAPLGERVPWIITGVIAALLIIVWIVRLAI
jgi:hypothetical protein